MINLLFVVLLAAWASLMSNEVNAAWFTVNSKVKGISTYGHTSTILVVLESQGRDIPLCSNKSAFAIGADMEQERRDRMYSMLLAARAASLLVRIAFEDSKCVSWSKSNVYRKITNVSI